MLRFNSNWGFFSDIIFNFWIYSKSVILIIFSWVHILFINSTNFSKSKISIGVKKVFSLLLEISCNTPQFSKFLDIRNLIILSFDKISIISQENDFLCQISKHIFVLSISILLFEVSLIVFKISENSSCLAPDS